jgi:hypothetical protein
MKTRSLFVLAVVLSCPNWAFGLETESFENEAQAIANGWTGSQNTINGNNFGYSSGTNFTGSTSGSSEAGGTMTLVNVLAYYADVTLGGSLTLDDRIEGSGEFEFTNPQSPNNNHDIGHFDTGDTQTDRWPDNIGIRLSEFPNDSGSQNSFRLYPNICFESLNGCADGGGSNFILLNGDGDYRFEYVYDPTIGDGRLSMTVFDSSLSPLGTKIIDIVSAHRTAGASFNAFGLMVKAPSTADSPNPSRTADIYIDNVSYSVPEPSSVALALIALLCVAPVRRK